ncbi:GNAT family N-acetyltransferase [Photobacterium sp.]|uniref:GNAT family N-acetyltransferase n=1 Tax=Photobacterium sp. TaxID=660 RepID=UPI0039AF3105
MHISIKEDGLFIGDIYIHDYSRRSGGIGNAVLSLAIQLARRKGYERIYGYCSVGESNPVHNFYRRLGFDIYPETGLLDLRLNDNI